MKFLKYPNGDRVPVADEDAVEHQKRIMRTREIPILIEDEQGKPVPEPKAPATPAKK